MLVVALAASLILVGAGHFTLGHVRRGIRWVLVWWVVSLSVPLAPVFGLMAGLLVRIANAVDVLLLPASKGRIRWRQAFAGWAVLGVIALWSIAARAFYVQPFTIASVSMSPTLLPGDEVLVNKFIYRFRDPRQGEVIVFKTPWDERVDFVKRVIAVGGEEVALKDGTVLINGRPLVEPYAVYSKIRPSSGPGYEYGPAVVPQGSYFVMGDNRESSQDSRFWGFLKREKIRGKSFVIYWSWDSEKGRPRWSRLGISEGNESANGSRR